MRRPIWSGHLNAVFVAMKSPQEPESFLYEMMERFFDFAAANAVNTCWSYEEIRESYAGRKNTKLGPEFVAFFSFLQERILTINEESTGNAIRT